MKVALVHYAYAPVVGGVERVMEEHARLFAAHGHEVTVLCQRGESADLRVRAVHLPAENCASTLRPVLAASDVVFIHNVATMPFDMALTNALAQLADELPAVRFIAWVHDIAACNPDLAPVPELLRRAHPRYRYIAVSELRARQFRELTGANCVIIPNGLDPARVLGLPANVARFADEFSLLDGRIVLFHPTRLLRRKNVEASLAVIAAMKSQSRTAVPAVVVGQASRLSRVTPLARSIFGRRDACHTPTGGTPVPLLLITGAEDPHNPASRDYAAWLRAERARLGIEREAIFVGEHIEIADAELAALYTIADALIFPSRSEGFGLPMLEAALHRLPVFAADIEPLRAIAPAGAAFFDLAASPAAIAAQIISHLSANSAHIARKAVCSQASWRVIYNRHIAPLLIS